jgi:hypothetical protein
MNLTQPKRVSVIFDAGEMRLCQIIPERLLNRNKQKLLEGLVIMRDGKSKRRIGNDGSFTVEHTKEIGRPSSALQLGIDGQLLLVQETGPQWRFTGKELHAMQQLTINSPRAKLQAAKRMDAKLNK